MKGASGIEVRLYGIGATLWLSASLATQFNPVHVASLEVLACRCPARLLYSRLIGSSTRRPGVKLRRYTPRSLLPRRASCRRLWLRSTLGVGDGGSRSLGALNVFDM
ncbi:hypothetical protein B0H13DRAFT_2095504 [Mycena leptocephala]|nr:hypothetical protein B0H13DRAFT_2095504 [Mycena leptocephala]